MSYESKKLEKAYGDGQKDAEEAGFMDKLLHGVGDVIGTVVPSTKEHDSREAGWHDKVSGKK